MLQHSKMKHITRNTIPTQTPPGLTRSAQGGSVKSAMGRERGVKGGLGSLRIGSVNVKNNEEGGRGCGYTGYGMVVDMVVDMAARYGCQNTIGFLLSSADLIEMRGCKKVGRIQVFLDGLLEGNSKGRTAGGRKVDRKGAGSKACERETNGGDGNCRDDCAELDFWKTFAGEGRILHLIGEDCVRDR